MITYKIYKLENFEEIHKEYFESLLQITSKNNCLSPNLDEIIITDNIENELEKLSPNERQEFTKSREYSAVGKIIDIGEKKKIFFDANIVHGYSEYTPQVFLGLLIEVYAGDIINSRFPITRGFHSETSFSDVMKILFAEWATKVISNKIEHIVNLERKNLHSDVKMFVDSYKRNIRKLHYQYQEDQNIGEFWTSTVLEFDYFIRRCLDVYFENGNFSQLQEFSESIPSLLREIETQTKKILDDENIDIEKMKAHVLQALNKCFIDVTSEQPMIVKITETPKKLFKGNLIDTEPRIVAFIDILGFTSIIDEYDSEKTSNILNELHQTLESAIATSIDYIRDLKGQTDLKEFLEYRMFSDCICISLPFIEFGNDFHIQFFSLATIVKTYQLSMMQKGFFVRGGISIGSFFADKHMIFSGALVSAYKLEKAASKPIIAIDDNVLKRLNKNFSENSRNLFYENLLLHSESDSSKIFLNPYDLLDNSNKYLDYLQSTMDKLVEENEKEKDPILDLANSFLKLTNTFTKPIFEYAKAQITPEKMNETKQGVLNHISKQIIKQNLLLVKYESDKTKLAEINKIISKYQFLQSLTNWSMGIEEVNKFKYYYFQTIESIP